MRSLANWLTSLSESDQSVRSAKHQGGINKDFGGEETSYMRGSKASREPDHHTDCLEIRKLYFSRDDLHIIRQNNYVLALDTL